MANINLLPWRDELRKQQQNQFYGVIGVVVVAAALIVYAMSDYYASAIEQQNQRNDFIVQQSRVLDSKIKEIQELKDTRQRLIERMTLIQALQGDRPVIVRMFDEMARAVPDDLLYNSVVMKGNNITVKGIAKSNSRISGLMRNYDQSQWFADPTLVKVQSRANSSNEFEVRMRRVQPKKGGVKNG